MCGVQFAFAVRLLVPYRVDLFIPLVPESYSTSAYRFSVTIVYQL